jgi:hypothetical protein
MDAKKKILRNTFQIVTFVPDFVRATVQPREKRCLLAVKILNRRGRAGRRENIKIIFHASGGRKLPGSSKRHVAPNLDDAQRRLRQPAGLRPPLANSKTRAARPVYAESVSQRSPGFPGPPLFAAVPVGIPWVTCPHPHPTLKALHTCCFGRSGVYWKRAD